MSCLFSLTYALSFIQSRPVIKMHISYDITTSDFSPLRYHSRPYDSLYLHSFPYFLNLICESDSVIYNPLARDRQIGRMVVEIISGLAMVCGEWSGVHAYGFICETSSAVSAERAPDKPVKVSRGGRMQCMGQCCGIGEKKNDELRRWKKKKDREWPPMVRGENKTEREMVMSCANDESLHSVLRGGTALGTASRPYFCSCFSGLTCNPSVEEYRGYVWTCCLPACWGGNFCIWMGGKG